MYNGKMKALTFSYDDGVTQDIRLVEIFNKYGLKATFNLNSGRLGEQRTLTQQGITFNHNKVQSCDVRHIYEGHEIAAHTVRHPNLTKLEEADIISQVEGDRLALSDLAGYEVKGFAYPCGGVNYDSRVSEIIRKSTGVKYCRTIVPSRSFEKGENLYEFKPTIHHAEFDELEALAEQFINAKPDTPMLFYVWGHSYEFDMFNNWDRFDEFCKMISGRDDIFYGTNRECLL